jgi:hypothetical protein
VAHQRINFWFGHVVDIEDFGARIAVQVGDQATGSAVLA